MTNLHSIFQEAAAPYQTEWIDRVTQQYRLFYDDIQERLPYARERCAAFEEQLSELQDANIGEAVTPDIRRIENLRRPFLRIAESLPAQCHTQDDYINIMGQTLANDYNDYINRLADKALLYGMNPETATVKDVNLKENQLQIILSDHTGKVINASLSWKGINSLQMNRPFVLRINPVKVQDKIRTHQFADDNEQVADNKTLSDRLHAVLDFIQPEWHEKVRAEQADFYDRVHSKLPFAKQRMEELKREIYLLQGLAANRVRIHALTKIVNTFNNVVTTKPAMYEDKNEYLKMAERQWNDTWEKAIDAMVLSCRKNNMNLPSTKINSIVTKPDGGELTMTDKNARRITLAITLTGKGKALIEPRILVRVGEVVDISRKQQDKKKLLSLSDASLRQNPRTIVTKAKIIEYNGRLFVTCHINGKQQSPVPMNPEEWQRYKSQPGADKTGLAIAHFPKEIAKAMSNTNIQTDNPSMKTIKR